MSYINVLPRMKQWICPKQWSSQSTRMSPGCYSSGYSEHSRLAAFRLPEYFRNVPLQSCFFKLKLDPLCSSYCLPHPIPESVFTLLRVSCGSITGQLLISITYSARNSWVHPQAQSRPTVTHHLGVLSNSPSVSVLFPENIIVVVYNKNPNFH